LYRIRTGFPLRVLKRTLSRRLSTPFHFGAAMEK